MKVVVVALVGLGVMGGGAGWWYFQGSSSAPSQFRTTPVERGNLLATVGATGTVQAENVVDVGAQNQIPCQIRGFGPDFYRNGARHHDLVSGVASLFGGGLWGYTPPTGKPIDFCSPVKKGQILAQLDESVYIFQRDQAEAEVANFTFNVEKLKADVVQMQARLKQAASEWERAQRTKGVISAAEFDLAQANFYTSKAIVDAAAAALVQAQKTMIKSEAALKQAETNLGYCTIRSPIDGIIVDRRVNVGQTVVSGLTASSLFLIAEDLGRLEVWASVNEADVGSIRKGQKVRFTVDAFQSESFYGLVKEIRLNAQMTQNVVTYPVVVSVDNSSGRLLPYMTANLQFETNHRENVLMVPNAALRWKPQASHVIADKREAYVKSLQRKPTAKPGAGDKKDKESHMRATVWVLDGSFVRPVRLRIGLSDGNMTEVVKVEDGTLTEGQELVTGATSTQSEETVNPFAPQMPQRGGKN